MPSKKPGKPEADSPEKEAEYVPPPMPPIPSKDGRRHRATYAKRKDENKNPMPGYNIRVEGPHAKEFSRKWVPVTRVDGTEAMEHCLVRLWEGKDEETGIPVALYTMWKKPREQADEIPF